MRKLNLYLSLCLLLFTVLSCDKNGNNVEAIIPPLPNLLSDSNTKVILNFLNEEISNDPNNLDLLSKRAELLIELNQIEKAQEDISRALAKNQNSAHFRYLNSVVLMEKGNVEKALNEAKLAELLGLKSPELYAILGALSQKNNKIEEAKKYLNYALKLAPTNGEIHFFNADLQLMLKDTTLAIETLNLAKKYKPSFLKSYKRLTEIYTHQGNTAMAMDISFQLAQQFPNDYENSLLIAKIYQRRNNIDSALIFYKKTLALKPNLYQASYDAGVLSLKNKYFTDALSFFENTYKYAPKTPFINTSIGMCYENLGNATKALDYYSTAFAINNNDFKAIEGIKRLEPKPIYVTEGPLFSERNKVNPKVNNIDTVKIRVTEITPKKITTKRDSNRLQNSNKFILPTIK
jgi:tetratricopeptide (TPR) repeat protein